jgi:glycosyltransferase involved in cell wall biosynthesis
VRISAVIPNLATNCIVRSWPIIKVLQRRHEVEIIGSLFGDDEIFPLYAQELSYQVVRWDKPWRILHGVQQIAKVINGELIYAFKPLTASLGAALIAKLERSRPVILDVEDWETWALHPYSRGLRHILDVGKELVTSGYLHPHALGYRYVTERLASLSDRVTVVSTFLQERFGGVKLPHGPDTTVFDPFLYDRHDLRDKWGIPPHTRLILFAGTPSPYKGLEDILEALDLLTAGRPNQVRLLMVGRDEQHVYTRKLVAQAQGRILHLGPQPHALMPELLALSDMVVLPQRRTPIAAAQVPAKVFEAMAMAKPIVATRISDLPEILDGCGMIVEPEEVSQLAGAIDRLLHDGSFATEMGKRARDKCVQQYSWDAMEHTLTELIESLV